MNPVSPLGVRSMSWSMKKAGLAVSKSKLQWKGGPLGSLCLWKTVPVAYPGGTISIFANMPDNPGGSLFKKLDLSSWWWLFRGIFSFVLKFVLNSEECFQETIPWRIGTRVDTIRKESPLHRPQRKLRGTYLALVWHVPLQLSFVISEKDPISGSVFSYEALLKALI